MYANGQHAQFGSKLTTCVYVYIGSYLVADMRLLRYKSLSRVGSTKAAVFPEQVRTMSIVKETQTRGVDRKKRKGCRKKHADQIQSQHFHTRQSQKGF